MNIIRLKEIREDRDLKQVDIARILRISQVVYSRYETGVRLMPIDKLDRLADYYEVSIDYLLGRTDEIVPYPRSALEYKKKNTSIKNCRKARQNF